MINMKDYVCLIDPSFINARKYCYWHVLPFPAGSAEVLREMFLAKRYFLVPTSARGSAHRDFCIQTCSSSAGQFPGCTVDVKSSAKAPLSLQHCYIPASPAHLQRILFWPEKDEPRWQHNAHCI